MATSSARPRDEIAVASTELRRAVEPGELGWLVVLPCAVLIVSAILLLGPPLGHAFLEPRGDRFWPATEVHIEPVEHARYLLALLAAPLGAVAVLLIGRRPPLLRARLTRTLIALTQACTLGFLALMLLAQHDVLLRSHGELTPPAPVLPVAMIVAAAVGAPLMALALGRPRLVARLAVLARETRARRVGCALVALVLISVWLLAAFNTEDTIGNAEANHLIPWDMAETFAVLDHRTPLLDFHSQYAQLVPYLTAGALRVVGTSVEAWTGTMLVFSALALLAVFGVLRRIVRSSTGALALFVPFLAGTSFLIFGRLSPLEIFSLWPMRYGGPYLLAWLTVRHLDGAAPRRRWLLLTAAGLVGLNNLEFGLPSAAGALVAMAYVDPPRSRRAVLRLAADGLVGALAAVAVVSALTLLHGGALPRFGLLLEFPRIYGVGGWVLEPMAAAGLHVALFVTFVAAVMVATVRAVRGDANRLLTAMLVWSGIFGLGAGSYYVGRSDPLNLISLFSAWSFALVLLSAVVVERLTRTRARPGAGDLVVLFGIGLLACAVLQMPQPWGELERLRQTTAPVYAQPDAVRLVAQTTRRGEKIAILAPLGHRVAFDAGVTNVAPYSGIESMPTVEQLDTTLDAIRREGVTRLYLDEETMLQEAYAALIAAGFVQTAARSGRYVMLERSSPSS